ncbi:DUF4097 family beta strand repeat-containing protein [Nocardia heshunensis]
MPAFQTSAPIAVTVEILSGHVTVDASDRTETVVEVRPADPAKKGDVRAAELTRVDFADGVLTVKTPKQWRTYTPFGGNPSIEVTIAVPTGSRLTGSAGVGSIHGTGELGETALEIAVGEIVVDRPGGSVTAKAAKGDIRIGAAVRGVMRLETSMGELEVGIDPGSAARLETNGQVVHNQLSPVVASVDTVQVIARNTMGNIIIRHAA